MEKNKKKIIIAVSMLIIGVVVVLLAFKFGVKKEEPTENDSNNDYIDNNNQNNDNDQDNENNDDNQDSDEPNDSEDEDNSDIQDNDDEKNDEEESKPETPEKPSTEKPSTEKPSTEKPSTSTPSKPSEDKPSTSNPPVTTTYKFNVYKDANNNYCKEKSNACDKVAFTIEVESLSAKIVTFDDSKSFMLYNDNGLKLYNIKKNSNTKLNLESNVNIDKFILNSNKDNVVGLIYKDQNNKYYGYYNIASSKKFYENKYVSITESDNKDYLIGVSERINNIATYALLKANENKIVVSDKDDGCGGLSFIINSYNGVNLYMSRISCLGGTIKIYSNSSKLLLTTTDEDYYEIYNGNLYFNSNNVIKKYDYNGNIVTSNNLDGNFKHLINDKVIYVKDNSLMIQDINTKAKLKVDDWNEENYLYHGENAQIIGSSGYYSKKQLDSLNKKVNETLTEEGIYLIVGYKSHVNDDYAGMLYFYNNKEIKKYSIKKTY